ncbi:potassium-transporting ATPase subunit KdpC [Bordetella genomosp. 12]|uniref:Potassium-transporting ATPase KdpC subunit n=1 Tax=Bordetella genomosp. 12 TaxID=463035 RepID=A0A261VB36_9BORD|nr:potassium-transporting ATPase subunit KdpC [Bordetella genomosp. 12]OZI71205.1 potassium-transporting ATPase subunit C [Bordetella genomosp. 12]
MPTAYAPSPASRPTRPGALLRPSLGLAAIVLLLFGLSYSLVATGIGRALFPHAAQGSLLERAGQVIGSALVAQPFAADGYFQPRPSAANYDLMALAGSNQARGNPELRARLDQTRAAIAAREGITLAAVPGDLLTQSGSGIDPHISPQSARIQIARIARARMLPAPRIAALVAQHTEGPQWGWFGQPRINVLQLNLALDALSATNGLH